MDSATSTFIPPVAITAMGSMASPEPAHDHLPKTVEALMALSDPKKVVIATVTASGCDAGAYYAPDANGQLLRQDSLNLYPHKHHDFTAAASRDGEQKIDEHLFKVERGGQTEYHLEVPDTAHPGQLKGLFVLHPSDAPYAQAEADSTKTAKLRLARFVSTEHADLLDVGKEVGQKLAPFQNLPGWQAIAQRRSGSLTKERETHHREMDNKLRYFSQLAELMQQTLGTEPSVSATQENIADYTAPTSRQKPHVHGVADLDMLALEAVNAIDKRLKEKMGAHDAPPLVDARHMALARQAVMLHDVGKVQMAADVFKAWNAPSDDEKKRRETYTREHNHHHPLGTLLMLMLYPHEAVSVAAHHHGIFRYSEQEIKDKQQELGQYGYDSEHFHILEKNIDPKDISRFTRLLRIADVFESMTGSGGMTVDKAIETLASKVEFKDGQAVIGPSTIDPEALAFYLSQGVMDKYAQKREAYCKEHGTEWKAKNGEPKYDAEKTAATSRTVLQQLGYDDEKLAKLAIKTHQAIAADPLVCEPSAKHVIAKGTGR